MVEDQASRREVPSPLSLRCSFQLLFFLTPLTLLRTSELAGAWEMPLQPGHIYLRRSKEPRAEAAACPWQHEELRHTITAAHPHSLCDMWGHRQDNPFPTCIFLCQKSLHHAVIILTYILIGLELWGEQEDRNSLRNPRAVGEGAGQPQAGCRSSWDAHHQDSRAGKSCCLPQRG